MRKIGMVALALVAALAACSKPTPGRSDKAGANGSATAAAAGSSGSATAVSSPLNPGEWETAVEMKMTGLPANLPPEAAKALRGAKMVTRHCLTPEKASRPTGDLFSGKAQEGCSRQDVSMTGGRLHGTLICKDPRGATSTMTMDGSYGGVSFDVRMTLSGEHQGQTMGWESHSVGHRIAPSCSAGTKED
jgi:hypothetical protein